jgi:small subunit ribosomal protein S20
MPLTRSAIKKLRQDKKREKENEEFKKKLKDSVKKAKKGKDVNKAVSIIDKAVKKNIYHKNKASRIKSSLVKNNKKDGGTDRKTDKKPASSVKKPKSKKKTS